MYSLGTAKILSTELYILIVVYRLGGKATVWDILVNTKLDQSTVLHAVRKLVKRGLVVVKGEYYEATREGLRAVEEIRKLVCGG